MLDSTVGEMVRAPSASGQARWGDSTLLAETVLFLGDNLMAWILLALGGALAVGTAMAMARPPEQRGENDLERPPVVRSVVMIVLGASAAVWALASLLAG
jgi:hypothetical protein